MNWIAKCLKQSFDFKGRVRRREFGIFVLFSFLFCFVFGIGTEFIAGLVKPPFNIRCCGGVCPPLEAYSAWEAWFMYRRLCLLLPPFLLL